MLEAELIKDIFTLAYELEPDYKNWTYQPHSWCVDASREIEKYLDTKGIAYRKSRPFDSLGQPLNLFADGDYLHAWVELADGTIIDPTIKQFFLANRADCACQEIDETCYSCQPYLNPGDYEHHTLWIVEPDDLYHRHLYIYADEETNALCSAIESRKHPLA